VIRAWPRGKTAWASRPERVAPVDHPRDAFGAEGAVDVRDASAGLIRSRGLSCFTQSFDRRGEPSLHLDQAMGSSTAPRSPDLVVCRFAADRPAQVAERLDMTRRHVQVGSTRSERLGRHWRRALEDSHDSRSASVKSAAHPLGSDPRGPSRTGWRAPSEIGSSSISLGKSDYQT